MCIEKTKKENIKSQLPNHDSPFENLWLVPSICESDSSNIKSYHGLISPSTSSQDPSTLTTRQLQKISESTAPVPPKIKTAKHQCQELSVTTTPIWTTTTMPPPTPITSIASSSGPERFEVRFFC